MGLKEFASDQPILAGCLGVITLGVVASCGLGALLAVGAKGCMNAVQESVGLDSLMQTVADAAEQGYSLGVNSHNGATVFQLVPMEARDVTCDELKAVLLPHLTGTLETVVVYSESVKLNADGSFTTVPLECTWSGYPSAKGGLAPLGPPETPAPETPAAPAPEAPAEAAPAAPAEPAPESTADPTGAAESGAPKSF